MKDALVSRLLGCLVAILLLALAVPATAVWSDEPEGAGSDAEEGAEPLSREEARRLEKLLSSAARKRDAADILPVLAEVGDRSHESFRKPLLKLLDHDSAEVALRAAEMLAGQQTEDEKDAEKLAKDIWKNGFKDRANYRRYVVQGRALVAVATHRKTPLDHRDLKEVEDLWRQVIGDPDPAYAPALIDVCAYVRLTKDKRLCRLLAEEIDEPNATAVNSGTNPPAEWWEKRWYLWKPVMAPCVEALEDLTGQSFKSTEAAKAWFEANEEEFGFAW